MGSLIRRRPEDLECYHAECQQYFLCQVRLGRECIRLGGQKIPREKPFIWPQGVQSGRSVQ